MSGGRQRKGRERERERERERAREGEAARPRSGGAASRGARALGHTRQGSPCPRLCLMPRGCRRRTAQTCRRHRWQCTRATRSWRACARAAGEKAPASSRLSRTCGHGGARERRGEAPEQVVAAGVEAAGRPAAGAVRTRSCRRAAPSERLRRRSDSRGRARSARSAT